MIGLSLITTLFAFSGSVNALEQKPVNLAEVSIPGPLSDGKPPQPTPKPEPIDFEVLTSHTQRMDVTEAPEMPGLPPVKGTINVTVQMVRDPGLPDPPPPLPALPPDDPTVIARMKEFQERNQGRKLISSPPRFMITRARFCGSILTGN